MLASPELASRNLAEAQRLFKQSKLVESRDMLDLVLFVYPFDSDSRALSGDIHLKIGRPESARRDYTAALTIDTQLTSAYAGRDNAIAMTAPTAGGWFKRGESANPHDLLLAMDKASLAGADVEALLADARRLHRIMAGTAVRYDELYQQRVRELEDAMRAKPKNPDTHLALAQYLIDEAGNRGEIVEPRRGRKPFRYQYNPGMELHRALHAASKALDLNPQYPRAMVIKALALWEMGYEQQANELVTQAVKLAGVKDAQAVRLLAEFRVRQAGRMQAQASALRTPTFSSSVSHENRHDGVYRVTTTYRHDPSGADLARADALDRQAAMIMQQTKAIMEAAIVQNKGTLDGLLLASAYEHWFGARDKALALLQQAVRDYPRELKAHDRLIDYLRFLGRHDDAISQEAISWQLFETTCAPLLRRVWDKVGQTGWGPLLEDLNQARRLNPGDARATAYLARAYADLGRRDQARAMARVAIALETARLELDEQGDGKSWPRDASDLALLMHLNNLSGRGAMETKEPQVALTYFQARAAWPDRFDRSGARELMFGAMLPSGREQGGAVPSPVNGATLASELYLGAAQSLKALGRQAESHRYLEAATRWTKPANDMTPNIGDGRGGSNFGDRSGGASAEALVELAKADIAARRYRQAMERLQTATQHNPSRELRREINDLIMSIKDKL